MERGSASSSEAIVDVEVPCDGGIGGETSDDDHPTSPKSGHLTAAIRWRPAPPTE